MNESTDMTAVLRRLGTEGRQETKERVMKVLQATFPGDPPPRQLEMNLGDWPQQRLEENR